MIFLNLEEKKKAVVEKYGYVFFVSCYENDRFIYRTSADSNEKASMLAEQFVGNSQKKLLTE